MLYAEKPTPFEYMLHAEKPTPTKGDYLINLMALATQESCARMGNWVPFILRCGLFRAIRQA